MAKQSVDQAILRIKTLEKNGDLGAAREMCQSLIAQYPANQRLRQTLQRLGQRRPKTSAAVIHPSQADLDVMVRMFGQKEYKAVLKHGEQLARRYPYSPILFNIIGGAAARLGKSDRAVEAFKRAVELDPGFRDALNNLGGLYKLEEEFEEAADCYARSLRFEPRQPAVLRRLAEVEVELELVDEAISHFRAAISLKPDDNAAYHGLANVLMDGEELEGALEAARRAVEIAPQTAEAHLTLGQVLRMQGETKAAAASFEVALEIKPDFASAYRMLGQIHKFKEGDPLTTRIQALYDTSPKAGLDRCHLAFALAKAHEDLGDAKTAFEFLTEANRLRRETTRYRFEEDVELFEGLRRMAPKLAELALPVSTRPVQTTPIFILAMPRSGTSLVEQIVSRHSMVAGGGELVYLNQMGMKLASGRTPATSRALDDVRNDYLAKIRTRAGGKPFLTDKMPHNFRLIALIRAAFPEAKIVHVHRDPAAVCWSNFKQFFATNGLQYADDLQDTVKFYGLYARLMEEWKSMFGDAIHTVDYERLTIDQEEETRKLIAYLGLPWEDACMAPHRNRRVVRTASEQQVKKAVYKGSSQEWRKFEPYLGRAFDALPK